MKAIRQADGITQNEMAETLGISKSHLCDIEKGRKNLSPERAYNFAQTLGYSEEHFVVLSLQKTLDDSGIDMKVQVAS